MKTTLLSTLFLSLTLNLSQAGNPSILNIKSGDATGVNIILIEKQRPELLIYLKKDQLEAAQQIISDNYQKQITIQINGNPVSKPMIQIKPPYKGKSVSIGFDTFDSAAKAAQQIVTTK